MNINDLEFKPHLAEMGGTQARIFFDNGYGASIVTGEMFYTDSSNPYEMAVLIGNSEASDLTYDTPITDDVIGYLNVSELEETLDKIAALPKESNLDAK